MDRQAASRKGRDPTEHKNSFKCCSLGNSLTNMMVYGLNKESDSYMFSHKVVPVVPVHAGSGDESCDIYV